MADVADAANVACQYSGKPGVESAWCHGGCLRQQVVDVEIGETMSEARGHTTATPASSNQALYGMLAVTPEVGEMHLLWTIGVHTRCRAAARAVFDGGFKRRAVGKRHGGAASRLRAGRKASRGVAGGPKSYRVATWKLFDLASTLVMVEMKLWTSCTQSREYSIAQRLCLAQSIFRKRAAPFSPCSRHTDDSRRTKSDVGAKTVVVVIQKRETTNFPRCQAIDCNRHYYETGQALVAYYSRLTGKLQLQVIDESYHDNLTFSPSKGMVVLRVSAYIDSPCTITAPRCPSVHIPRLRLSIANAKTWEITKRQQCTADGWYQFASTSTFQFETSYCGLNLRHLRPKRQGFYLELNSYSGAILNDYKQLDPRKIRTQKWDSHRRQLQFYKNITVSRLIWCILWQQRRTGKKHGGFIQEWRTLPYGCHQYKIHHENEKRTQRSSPDPRD
ncbi:hypothetical protein DFH06DRAFT_1141535 [Mycena polygramma]|nr:hypothetical protein DFH06DRAFT_1141535 [Mycena polygramma]